MNLRNAVCLPTAILVLIILLADTVSGAVRCPLASGASDEARPSTLFLYFPTVNDKTFAFDAGRGLVVDSAAPFNVSELSSYTGTVADLRDAIRDVVVDDYCEFNVKIVATTANPDTLTSPPIRSATIAIGSDEISASALYGVADATDINDKDPRDKARVWAGEYQEQAGKPEGELHGLKSTLARWAIAIGGTAAHEAGHLYGLAHSDDWMPNSLNECNGVDTGRWQSGEDFADNHLMGPGCIFSLEQRVGYRRHFSDVTFSILAANVGLSVQTVHNWDFTNPNNVDARQLRVTILSTASPLKLGWAFDGPASPWLDPRVSGPLDTVVFKGTTYRRYIVDWTTPNPAWTDGPPGVVPPAKRFHVGAVFTGVDFDLADPVVVEKVQLLNDKGMPLALQPRMVGYDNGSFEPSTGTLDVRFFNPDPPRPMMLKDIVVSELPRVAAITSMVEGAPLLTWDGQPVIPWRSTALPDVLIRDTIGYPIASLARGHNVEIFYEGAQSSSDAQMLPDEVNNDPTPGASVDLFPATMVLVTATVVDVNATFWDPVHKKFVRGPMESKLFYQFAGRRDGPIVTLAPRRAMNIQGAGSAQASHTIAATVSQAGAPLPGIDVTFMVIRGPHAGVTGTGTSGPDGIALFSYTGSGVGTDAIVATFVASGFAPKTQMSNEAIKIWAERPVCFGRPATVFVLDGVIVGGPLAGEPYRGYLPGTPGDDVIVGTAGPDLIRGFGGNDVICAGDGDDVIEGGDGGDIIDGGAGDDLVKGQAGHDTLYGRDGNDILEGGPGNDYLDSGSGADTLKGQGDTDICVGGKIVSTCEQLSSGAAAAASRPGFARPNGR